MERYIYHSLTRGSLDPENPYLCRFRLDKGESLCQSIREFGLLSPVLAVERQGKYALLSGHRRVQALLELGNTEFPVFVIQREATEAQRFLWAVLLNTDSGLSELDKLWVLHRASDEFHISEEKILTLVMPALGLQGHRHFLEECLKTAKLSARLLDLMLAKQLPVRGAHTLARFSEEDQIFFSTVGEKAAFTSNQLQQVTEWLWDLLRPSKESLRSFFRKNKWDELLESPADRRTQGDLVYQAVKKLRFPLQSEREKKFMAAAERLSEADRSVKLEAPPGFEEEGFTLKAKIRNAKSLDKLETLLQDKRKILNSILDIML